MSSSNLEQVLRTARDAPDGAALALLTNLYPRMISAQRQALREQWSRPLSRALPSWETLACELDGEPPPKLRIDMWMTWLSVNSKNTDWRDDLFALCHCYHAYRFLEANEDECFRRHAAYSSDAYSELIVGFIARPEPLKALEVFGMFALRTNSGMRILSAGSDWESIGRLDSEHGSLPALMHASLDVAKRLIDRGQYGGDARIATRALRRRMPGYPKPLYDIALRHAIAEVDPIR